MEILHKIDFGNGFVIVPEPKNFDSAEVDIIWMKDKARASMANLTLVWQGITAQKIYAVYESGKIGGKGVAHALPYRIEICGGTIPPFELMLVLGHSSAKYQCDQVELPAWAAQGSDWLEQQMQAYGFWYLASIGQITTADYKQTPYLISAIPNYTQVLTLSFSALVILWQLKELIVTFTDKATELTTDAAETAIPIVGTAHVFVVIGHVINIILFIVKVIFMLLVLYKFIDELIDNIIQKKKYKYCMREQDLFKKMCSFLGLNFSSSIYSPGSFLENATWMPRKIVMPDSTSPTFVAGIVGGTFTQIFDRPEDESGNAKSYGYFDGRFSEFVEIMERKYNAEAKINNGTLYFEKKYHWNNANPYQLPNTNDLGYTFNLPAPFRTNLSELAPYYSCEFQIDESDQNTIHRYKGTSCAIQVLSPFPISKYSGWGQGKIIDLGSALAKRKEHLNKIENFLDIVLNIVHTVAAILIAPINLLIAGINLVIQAVNLLINAMPSGWGVSPISLVPTIPNPINLNALTSRIGWMELTNDSFNIPKTFNGIQVGNDWELDPNTEVFMSAFYLLNNFHDVNLATRGAQRVIYENNKTRFCCHEFQQISGSNILVAPDGRQGEFDTMKWNLKKESARDIIYRIKETYLSGLTEKMIIDGTQ